MLKDLRRCTMLGLLMALAAGAAHAQDDTAVTIGYMASNEGPVAPLSIGFHDGLADYLTLVNTRDGGVEGRPVELAVCETGFTLEGHLRCYQELAAQGAVVVLASMTEGAYAVNRAAPQVGVPVLNGGLGQTAGADGEVFPLTFTFPANYLQAASAIVRFLEEERGGSLRGARIGFVYHDSGFGQEPIGLLRQLAADEGFALELHPIAPPGEDQTALWAGIAADPPDQVVLWTVGLMTPTAIGTAAAVGYPREQMLGIWWTTFEGAMRALGPAADGMRAINFMSVGFDVPVYNQLNEIVYFGGLGNGTMNNVGQVDYNRGLMTGTYLTEAVRRALRDAPGQAMTPARMVAGLEALDLTRADLEALGLGEYMAPIQLSCANHGGYGQLKVIQWSAEARAWRNLSDFIAADAEIVDSMVSAEARRFAQEVGITPRDCPS
ncbi:MAG: ABC transporter substrate-binding protein [Pseudomonadota bacterium]